MGFGSQTKAATEDPPDTNAEAGCAYRYTATGPRRNPSSRYHHPAPHAHAHGGLDADRLGRSNRTADQGGP